MSITTNVCSIIAKQHGTTQQRIVANHNGSHLPGWGYVSKDEEIKALRSLIEIQSQAISMLCADIDKRNARDAEVCDSMRECIEAARSLSE